MGDKSDVNMTNSLPSQDAVNMVCNSKTRANPENTVALLTLGSLKVLSTLTNEVGKVSDPPVLSINSSSYRSLYSADIQIRRSFL